MVKQCSMCKKTFSVLKSLVTTNDQLTCEECAQDMIKEAEHDRRLKENRQKEEMKAAQHRRKMEADQQRHRQELEQKEHQKMEERKDKEHQKIEERKEKEHQKIEERKDKEHQKIEERKDKEHQKIEERKDKEHQKIEERKDKEHQQELELSMKRQDETERGRKHDRELQMEGIKMNGMVAMAEAEARKAEAKAKEAEAKANEANSMAKAAEAKMKFAEVEAKIKIAKTKEREMEHRSMLWKKYFDPETKMQDKQLIMEEIKRLQTVRSSDQNVNKAPVVVKENHLKVPKSRGDSHPHRPWVTTMF